MGKEGKKMMGVNVIKIHHEYVQRYQKETHRKLLKNRETATEWVNLFKAQLCMHEIPQ
jgi:hypothetical protein